MKSITINMSALDILLSASSVASSGTAFGMAGQAVSNILKILASPGGQAILERLFSEGGITLEKLESELDKLPPLEPIE